MITGSMVRPALPQVSTPPQNRAAIVAELRRVLAESNEYWRSTYDDDAFFRRRSAEEWAPVDQVRHLTKSCRAIARGFEIPKILLLLRFGLTLRASRDYAGMLRAYEERLQRPIRNNPFAPRALEPNEQTPEGRARVMQQHVESVERLCRALGRYGERSLDRLRARHPALGMITLRELALFALLHNIHHVHVAEGRRQP